MIVHYMERNIKLKIATIEDLNSIIEVGDLLFDNKINIELAIEFLADPRHHLAVAYDGKHLVGMMSGFHYEHPDKQAQLFINEAGVLDRHQGKGIGRRLIEFLCRYSKDLGCKEAWVLTEKSNVSARKAYKSAGGIENPGDFIMVEYSL